jgi:hypothetical protein
MAINNEGELLNIVHFAYLQFTCYLRDVKLKFFV